MAEMSVERLREIRERWERLAKAPPCRVIIRTAHVFGVRGDDDAALWSKTLAEAPEHVRKLLAEVERLRSELAERDRLIGALTETAEWAFEAGGWRLWYFADVPADAVRAITNYDTVMEGDALKLRIDGRVADRAERLKGELAERDKLIAELGRFVGYVFTETWSWPGNDDRYRAVPKSVHAVWMRWAERLWERTKPYRAADQAETEGQG